MSLYDKEQPLFLDACFASLCGQTLQAAEIVLVLDGPIRADLMNVIEQWQAKLPIVIVALPVNIGLAMALNEGLKQCRYDYIARMDSDDICDAQRFEKQFRFLRKHPDISLLGGYIDEFDEDETMAVSCRQVPLRHSDIEQKIKLKSPFNHVTVVFRKDALLAVGGYQNLRVMQDYDLWLRMVAAKCKTANIPDILVHVRVGNGMLTRRRGMKCLASEIRLARLKVDLNVQNRILAFFTFVVRSVPRFLPKPVLALIYRMNRTAIH